MIVGANSAVSAEAFWADFDRVLNPEDVMLNPGPEWQSISELLERSPYGRQKLEYDLKAAVLAGTMEMRKGRRGGKVKPLYHVL